MTKLSLALALLVAAGALGRFTEQARRDAGIPLVRARVPLGGFEPLAVDLLWLRAEALRSESHLIEAAAAYRLVMELEPKVDGAWTLPASLLAWTDATSGDPEREWAWISRALDLLRRGLEENPDSPAILRRLGIIYYRRIAKEEDVYEIARRHLGEPPEIAAIRTFGRLLDREPGIAVAFIADSWVLLAGRYDAAGDLVRAREAYERALPLWRRIAEETKSGEAAAEADRIADRLESLPPR